METELNLSAVFNALGLAEWQHVVVRRKGRGIFECIGGGTAVSVCRRFGNYKIDMSIVQDGILFVYVK